MLNENLKNFNDWTFQYRKAIQSRFDETNIAFFSVVNQKNRKKNVWFYSIISSLNFFLFQTNI